MTRPQASLGAAPVATMIAAARAALPRETGGILLGWRHGSSGRDCTVTEAIEVGDAQSGRATYQRQHAAAEEALRGALAVLDDSDVGYVGEWHSHPEPHPPSAQDLHSIRGVARLAPAAVVLVVPALDPRADNVTWHALTAFRRWRLPTVTVQTSTVQHPGVP